MDFKICSKYKPSGDQPQAIDSIVKGFNEGLKSQVLLGVTGSGKTFTMANIIEKLNKPTLIIAHNKTLAAQLCNEFRELFPQNRVEFFVSYYDYYQPEAYISKTDTYIEKDMSINEEIDKLRHSATSSLLERRDVIVVASVSCIYGLGAPEDYYKMHLSLREGDNKSRKEVTSRLVEIRYDRNDIDFKRGTFRVRGDVVDIFPASSGDSAIRVEFFGDEIDSISEIDVLTGKVKNKLSHAAIFPANHYTTSADVMKRALEQIEKDKDIAASEFLENGKYIEEQRIKERVCYDMEMMKELGYCSGIENYSRYFDGRNPGEAPYTLMDYFPDDFIVMIDECHMTLPQIHAMYAGDRSRKESLVKYGFRLPSAFDNRPLTFEEFEQRLKRTLFVSATPNEWEINYSGGEVVEQVIRPTGLLDPIIEVRETKNQVDAVLEEIERVISKKQRVLITTLTKKMAERLTDYLLEHGIKATYMHSDIDTLERVEIVNSLRKGEKDVLVGINLLREGLDLPEVSLVVILDADKEGFLRSEGALIQTIGRAARNSEGKVIMFADVMTKSMQKAIDVTKKRRALQQEYNEKNGIIPKTIEKNVQDLFSITKKDNSTKRRDKKEIEKEIANLKKLMEDAADKLDFEKAIEIREYIKELTQISKGEK